MDPLERTEIQGAASQISKGVMYMHCLNRAGRHLAMKPVSSCMAAETQLETWQAYKDPSRTALEAPLRTTQACCNAHHACL